MGNHPSGSNYYITRNGLKLTKEELDERCKPSGLYSTCPWDDEAIRRLIRDGQIAKRSIGTEVQMNDTDIFCPICFLYHTDINKTKCCSASICTECYLQARPQKLPKQKDTGRVVQIACPFCKNNKKKFKVIPFGKGKTSCGGGSIPSNPPTPTSNRHRKSFVLPFVDHLDLGFDNRSRNQERIVHEQNHPIEQQDVQQQQAVEVQGISHSFTVQEPLSTASGYYHHHHHNDDEEILISNGTQRSTASTISSTVPSSSSSTINHSSLSSRGGGGSGNGVECTLDHDVCCDGQESRSIPSSIESSNSAYGDLYLLEQELRSQCNSRNRTSTTIQPSTIEEDVNTNVQYNQHHITVTDSNNNNNSSTSSIHIDQQQHYRNAVDNEDRIILEAALILSMQEHELKEKEERRLIQEEVDIITASTVLSSSSSSQVGARSVMPLSEEEQLRLAIEASLNDTATTIAAANNNNSRQYSYDYPEGYINDINDMTQPLYGTVGTTIIPSSNFCDNDQQYNDDRHHTFGRNENERRQSYQMQRQYNDVQRIVDNANFVHEQHHIHEQQQQQQQHRRQGRRKSINSTIGHRNMEPPYRPSHCREVESIPNRRQSSHQLHQNHYPTFRSTNTTTLPSRKQQRFSMPVYNDIAEALKDPRLLECYGDDDDDDDDDDTKRNIISQQQSVPYSNVRPPINYVPPPARARHHASAFEYDWETKELNRESKCHGQELEDHYHRRQSHMSVMQREQYNRNGHMMNMVGDMSNYNGHDELAHGEYDLAHTQQPSRLDTIQSFTDVNNNMLHEEGNNGIVLGWSAGPSRRINPPRTTSGSSHQHSISSSSTSSPCPAYPPDDRKYNQRIVSGPERRFDTR